jgi:hypothetical protein
VHTCTQGYSSRLFSQYRVLISDSVIVCHLHHSVSNSVETTDCSRVSSPFVLNTIKRQRSTFRGLLRGPIGKIFLSFTVLRVVLNSTNDLPPINGLC